MMNTIGRPGYGAGPPATTNNEQKPPEHKRRPMPRKFLTSLPRRRGGWFANHALQRLCAVRSSVAGVRERTVRSTRAAEAVAELGSLAHFAHRHECSRLPD